MTSHKCKLNFMQISSSTKNNIQCHQFQLSRSILIGNIGIVSPILNVNPTLFVIPCKFLSGGIDLYCCNYYHSPSDFSSKFRAFVTIFHHKLLTREGKALASTWINSSTIHDNICSLVHRICYPKMTSNTIFSVVHESSNQCYQSVLPIS